MFKKLVCDFTMDYSLELVDPILIKSGLTTVGGANLSFVLTYRGGSWEPYIPGTSIKGVLRSHSERIAATLNPSFSCNPFVKDFCGNKFQSNKEFYKKEPAAVIYNQSCPICRTFGSTWFAGRFCPSDAYITGNYSFETRDGVGIDRFTGGAAKKAKAKFNMKVLTRGTFQGNIVVRNFELWQLGLVAFLFRDLAEGYIRFGSGTSRGLGRVKGIPHCVRISYLGERKNIPQNKLVGVGELVREKEYGFTAQDQVSLKLSKYEDLGIRHRLNFTGEEIDKLWAAVAPKWVDYIKAYDPARTEKSGRR